MRVPASPGRWTAVWEILAHLYEEARAIDLIAEIEPLEAELPAAGDEPGAPMDGEGDR